MEIVKPNLQPTVVVNNSYNVPENMFQNVVYNGAGTATITLPKLINILQGQPMSITNFGGSIITVNTVDLIQINNITTSDSLSLEINKTVNLLYDNILWVVTSITDANGGANFNIDPIPIGINAGKNSQQLGAIAIGSNAGYNSQNGIAIGTNSGYNSQARAVAIGVESGYNQQGLDAIAIGYRAGYNNQASNSIVLNATGVTLNANNSGLYAAPLRPAVTSNALFYNNTSKEITYGEVTIPIDNIKINDTYENTLNQYQVTMNSNRRISEATTTAYINGYPTAAMLYTFGKAQPARYVVCGGVSGTTIRYSYNGLSYNSCVNTFTTTGAGVAYNGYLWVAVGDDTTAANRIKYSFDGITWVNASSGVTFTGPAYNVAWSGSMWVAVGTGAILYSYDGINWLAGTGAFSTAGRDVVWNGSLWVAVGFDTTNTIKNSNDGINWTNATSGMFAGSASTGGRGLSWNGTVWIAVGDGAATANIKYSIDGAAWTNVSAGFTTNGLAVASNNTLSVAVGNDSTSSVKYSYDGVTWINGNGFPILAAAAEAAVSWVGSLWLLISPASQRNISYSYNGISWSSQGIVQPFTSGTFGAAANTASWPGNITFARNMSMVGGILNYGTNTGNIGYSFNDGLNFTRNATSAFFGSPTVVSNCQMISWNGNIWLATGNCGEETLTRFATNITIKYSYDGINWNNLKNKSGFPFNSAGNINGTCLAWGNNKWLAGGKFGDSNIQQIKYSYDGKSWFKAANFTSTGYIINSIQWGKDKWVMCGLDSPGIFYSYDGNTWNNAINGFNITGITAVYNGLIWVATGIVTDAVNEFNIIKYSYDGITWTNCISPTLTNRAASVMLAWNGNYWLLIASSNSSTQVYISYNGINWTSRNAAFTIGGNGIFWNGAYFIACGSGAAADLVRYSPDGNTWVSSATTGFSSRAQNGAWNNPSIGTINIFQPVVAVGAGNYCIAISENELTWTGVNKDIFTSGRGVCWNGNLWVAVGIGANTIAWSRDGYNWNGLGNSIFTIGGYGVCWAGDKFVAVGEGLNQIAYSSDGITWMGLSNNFFINRGNAVFYNGETIIAVGDGKIISPTYNTSIQTSLNGTNWTVNQQNLITEGRGVSASANFCIVVGTGTSTAIRTEDLINWSAVDNSFATSGNGVFCNSEYFVAVGADTNSIKQMSIDATSFTNAISGNFTGSGLSVTWSSKSWLVSGNDTNSVIKYTTLPITSVPNNWYNISNINNIFTSCNGIAGNPKVGVYIPSVMDIKKGDTISLITPVAYNDVNRGMNFSF